jgi:hypothetical protein
VGLVAVGLDDEALAVPQEVDLEARVVGRLDDGVDGRRREAGLAYEPEEARLEVTAGEGGLGADGAPEGADTAVAVGAREDVLDGAAVVELEALGLGERALELVGLDSTGDVEQGAGDRCDRNASMRRGVLGIEGTWAV